MEDKKEETAAVKPGETQLKGMVPTQDKGEFYKQDDVVTITPTMIDDSGSKVEKAKDLSAIIPKGVNEAAQSTDGTALTSKEKELKGDGATILATIDGNIEASMVETPVLPEQIDIDARKEAQEKAKTKKRVKKVKKSMKKEHQMQNFGSLIAIFAILIIAGAVYYYFNHPTDADFQPLTVVVEYGDSLPIQASYYVKPGVGNRVDDLQYIIDKSEVVRDRVGEYPFKVTHNGITKTGKVIIRDTTPPKVKVLETKIIAEGEKYTPDEFILECLEADGCTYKFQDEAKVSSYTSHGSYTLYIVASDIYNNQTQIKVTLIIESQDDIKKYIKKTPFDFGTGYEIEETYDLHFTEYTSYKLLHNGTHVLKYIYSSEEKYKEDKDKLVGEANYKFDDATQTITYTEIVTIIKESYSYDTDIDNYLKGVGFQEMG